MKLLGVLLCYNDADILEYAIKDLLESNHDIIVWDHGSTDGTAQVLDSFDKCFVQRDFIPRSYDFYKLYQRMSKLLISKYINQYDWISWPDQDEFLEGPTRQKSYAAYVEDLWREGYDSIQFNNYNYWYTEGDDLSVASPIERIRHYSLFPECSPRIRSWRASKTHSRKFNHNPIEGKQYPTNFNLRHYPMRTKEQMIRRIGSDRADLLRKGSNFHYANMASIESSTLYLKPNQLHFDDRQSELNNYPRFNWKKIYGYGVPKELSVKDSYFKKLTKFLRDL